MVDRWAKVLFAVVFLVISISARAEMNCAEKLVAERASAINDYWGRGDRWNLWRHRLVDPLVWRTLQAFVGDKAPDTTPLPLVEDFQYFAKQRRSIVSRVLIDPILDSAVVKLLRLFYRWEC